MGKTPKLRDRRTMPGCTLQCLLCPASFRQIEISLSGAPNGPDNGRIIYQDFSTLISQTASTAFQHCPRSREMLLQPRRTCASQLKVHTHRRLITLRELMSVLVSSRPESGDLASSYMTSDVYRGIVSVGRQQKYVGKKKGKANVSNLQKNHSSPEFNYAREEVTLGVRQKC